jgi:2-iminobutanoate/2-iminopropanoate deaminase
MAAQKKAPAKKAPAKKAPAKKAAVKKTAKAPAPIGPYTPVVRAGDWIIVSGQLGLKDGVMQKGVSAQTTQAVKNLKERLAEMGANINDVKKTL